MTNEFNTVDFDFQPRDMWIGAYIKLLAPRKANYQADPHKDIDVTEDPSGAPPRMQVFICILPMCPIIVTRVISFKFYNWIGPKLYKKFQPCSEKVYT